MRNLIFVLFSCLYFWSCGFARNEKISGKYHIISIDVDDMPCLAYEVDGNYISIVSPKIIAYSKVGRYILLKQKPYKAKFASDTNYYIVPILKGNLAVFPEDSVIGPLKKHEFDSLISKMPLGKWEFRKLDE